MRKLKLACPLLGAILASSLVLGCGDDDDNPPASGKANVRVIHASYDAPAVDVAVDDSTAITSLAYGKASGYAALDAGKRKVDVLPSAGGSAVISASLDLARDTDYTVYAVNMLSSIEAIVSTDARAPTSGKARIRFVHASPDAPAVDIRTGSASGTAVFSDVAFKDIESYADVDPGSYSFVVTPAGQTTAVVSYEAVTLEAGKTYTVIALGTLAASDNYDFTARVFIDNGSGNTSVDLKSRSTTPTKANVRVIHASYDGPPVDVGIDGAKAISSLAYGKASGYAALDAGKRKVTVTPSSGGSAVIDTELTLEAGSDYTVLAVDKVAQITAIFDKDERAADADKAKVRFIHASPDAPAVDIRTGSASGTAVFSSAAFKSISKYAAVAPGSYSFVVTPAGQQTAVVSYAPVTLEKGKVYTVVAIGTLATSDSVPFTARVWVDNGDGKTSLDLQAKSAKANAKVVHASPDAPGVDLLVDGTKVNSSALTFPSNTAYLPLDPGKRNIKVRPAGSSSDVINADVTVDAGKNYSIFAANTVAKIEPVVFEDDLTAPASGKAHVRFIHMSPDAPAVDIFVKGSSSALFANTAFKKATQFTPVAAGTYDLEVKLTSGGTTVLSVSGVELKDGKIYTIFANGFAGASKTPALAASIITNK